MSSITLFNGIFCKENAVARELRAATELPLIKDGEIVADAARRSHMAESKIARAFSAKTSVFNQFTHEKERAVAWLKLALADRLLDGPMLLWGFSGQLIPREISHFLRVCLIADMRFRLAAASEERRLSEKEALKIIHKEDEECALWMNSIFQQPDPWQASLYDMLIPMNKTTVPEAVGLITAQFGQGIIERTSQSEKALKDFRLAAEVELALSREGHHVGVTARGGRAVLTINKHVLMLQRLEDELKEIARKVAGVEDVETRVGPDFYKADIYRKVDFATPSRVLLVDDERDFVQTLSERLLMRQMGAAVAYDGESALDMVHEDEPDVMILDLKMPGIDGIEVLRRVKESHRNIEVIILTGHGSEADREVCMGLGAFAYLQKPVDIEILSETLRRAHDRIRERQEAKN
ncbi:MAG: response regulator [Proteobacteria bacterium]|nr:response regulator [Pseudomonadota bacterium]